MRLPVRLAVVGAVVAVTGLGAWLARPGNAPELIVGDTVANDLEALAQATFDRFLETAPAVAECTGRVRLEAASDLDDLARYDQRSGVVTVRVPATAPSLEVSLVHEFAHHLELACDSHLSLRPAFLAAQGHPADMPWFADLAWEERPSEQFAEAVAEVVLGRRSRSPLRLRLSSDALSLVEAWLTIE